MRKVLAVSFLIFLFFVAYWADTARMPEVIKALYRFPNGDRIGHFALYGMLAYLLTLAFPFKRYRIGRWTLSLSLGVLLAFSLATLEEASQVFIATRTPDLVDLAAGYLGIFAAARIPCLGAACPPTTPTRKETPHEDGPASH